MSASTKVQVPDATDGIALVPQPSPLTRLNYFDGKFLRAADLSSEQGYLRFLAHLVGAAGGPGVVNGYDVRLRSGALVVGAGMAYDGLGRPLLLPAEATVDVDELVRLATEGHDAPAAGGPDPDRARFGDCLDDADAAGRGPVASPDWWVVTIGHGETLCGEEDVYGRLCEDACAGPTDRPWRVEGVVVRLAPLRLGVPLPTSTAIPVTTIHLRSRLASAAFADEQRLAGSLVSATGLRSLAWCLGSRAGDPTRVPIALLVRSGGSNAFVDPWIVRRERIDPPNERYWHGRLRLRPWTVFLAQVLQFQCQLRDLPTAGEMPEDDPCGPAWRALGDVDELFDELAPVLDAARARRLEGAPIFTAGGFDRFNKTRLVLRKLVDAGVVPGTGRVLLDHGIVELPPAGYLPVEPGSAVAVETQVGRLLGEGVDLRFCVARPDVIAQAFRETQHLDRVSLTRGLDDPAHRPPVDVLVPDGVVESGPLAAPVKAYRAQLRLLPLDRGAIAVASEGIAIGDAPASSGALRGVATAAASPAGGFSLRMAAATQLPRGPAIATFERLVTRRAEPVDIRRSVDPPLAGDVPESDLVGVTATAARAARFSAMWPLRAVEGLAIEEAFRPSVEPGAGRTAAAWLDVTFDGDLRAVDGGDLVPVTARATVVSPAAAAFVTDAAITGRLAITKVVAGAGGGRVVEGRIGDGVIRRRIVVGGHEREDTTNPFRPDVTINVALAGAEVRHVTATIRNLDQDDDEALVLDVELRQGADEVDAQLAAATSLARRLVRGDHPADAAAARLPIGALELAADPSVLDGANSFNRLARGGIHVVAASVAEPGMDEATLLKLLFPTRPAAAAERIRATRDWVLFHHRRDRQCTGATPVIGLPDRLFDLYHVLVDDPEQLAVVRRGLAVGERGTLEKLGLRRVDRVAFAGGTATLSTTASAVADGWAAAQPGTVIVYGAVATQGEVDGPATNRNRVARVAEVVASVSRLDPRADIDALAGIPAGLAAAGVDGVIVIATTAAVETTCLDVRRMPIEAAATIMRLLAGGDVAGARAQTSELGVVRFDGSVPVEGIDEVAAAWAESGGSLVGGVTVSAGGEGAGSALERTERAMAVVTALRGRARVQDMEVGELEAACPVVLLLVPEREVPDQPDEPEPPERRPGHVVVAAKARNGRWRDDVEPHLADGVLDDGLLHELVGEQVVVNLGFVVYKPGTTDVGGPFTVRQLEDQLAFAGNVTGAVTLFERASLTEDPDVLAAQGAQAAKDVGVSIPAASVNVVEVPRPPVASREALTVLLIQRD